MLDADSHIMELPDFLSAHADPGMRDRIPPVGFASGGKLMERLESAVVTGATVVALDTLVVSPALSFSPLAANATIATPATIAATTCRSTHAPPSIVRTAATHSERTAAGERESDLTVLSSRGTVVVVSSPPGGG
ncbi:MAG: hypothetical protein QM733_13630 [Ilumatobacteraceae bacterium]